MLDAAPGIEYEVRTGLKGDALREALGQFEGAICRSGVKITADALEGNRRLKAIVRAGVGTDNIDKDAATRHGIVVMNTPGGNTLSTAEHTIALMLALSRNIAPAYESLKAGKWERNKYMGTQVAGKTLGIVGLGRIGVAVAKRARALEMNVLGYDPFMSKERAKELGIEPVETVADMLPRVDYLTVHTPLTDETRGLVGAAQLERMKKGVRLINAARGGIYDEAALAEGLKSGKVGGVALDVYATEPCTDSPLFGLPGVVCTPHLGASTEEAQTQVAVEAVELLVALSNDRCDSACGERGVARFEDVGIAARIFGRGPSAGNAAGRHGAGRRAGVPAHVSRRNCGEGDEGSYGRVCGRIVAACARSRSEFGECRAGVEAARNQADRGIAHRRWARSGRR